MSQSIAFGTPMARDSANASALRYAVLPGIMLLHYRALDELHASPVSALVLDHRGRSTWRARDLDPKPETRLSLIHI